MPGMASPLWNFLISEPSAGQRQVTPPAVRVAPFGAGDAGDAGTTATGAGVAIVRAALGFVFDGAGVTGLNTGAWGRAGGFLAMEREVPALRPPGDRRSTWPGQIVYGAAMPFQAARSRKSTPLRKAIE